MEYKLPVVIIPLREGGFLARCEQVRATATGDTCEEAVENFKEALEDLIQEYGKEAVFQEVSLESKMQMVEVAV